MGLSVKIEVGNCLDLKKNSNFSFVPNHHVYMIIIKGKVYRQTDFSHHRHLHTFTRAHTHNTQNKVVGKIGCGFGEVPSYSRNSICIRCTNFS